MHFLIPLQYAERYVLSSLARTTTRFCCRLLNIFDGAIGVILNSSLHNWLHLGLVQLHMLGVHLVKFRYLCLVSNSSTYRVIFFPTQLFFLPHKSAFFPCGNIAKPFNLIVEGAIGEFLYI